MKKITILLLTLFSFNSAYSQNWDKILRITEILSHEISNLSHEISNFKNDSLIKQTVKSLQDSVPRMEISHNDDIINLKTRIKALEIDTNKLNKKIKNLEANIVNSYKNQKFDHLIESSTKLSVERDIQLVGDNEEVKNILSDLKKYFNAQELLSAKYESAKIRSDIKELDNITQKSDSLLEKLKEKLDGYKKFNDALKETINKLINLDEKSSTANRETRLLKFNEIIKLTYDYMYDYYDHINYPYLSNIFLEIIKRKHYDPDADISDLLKKLQ